MQIRFQIRDSDRTNHYLIAVPKTVVEDHLLFYRVFHTARSSKETKPQCIQIIDGDHMYWLTVDMSSILSNDWNIKSWRLLEF